MEKYLYKLTIHANSEVGEAGPITSVLLCVLHFVIFSYLYCFSLLVLKSAG